MLAAALIAACAIGPGCGRLNFDPLADPGDPGDGGAGADGAQAACETPAGLVIYLPFDETSGDTTVDFSGNGHDGTLVGLDESARVAGRLGNALDFDGVDDHVTSGSDASLDDLPSMTMCAWIFPHSFPNEFPAIADKSSDTFVGGWNFYIERGNVFGFLTNQRKWATGGVIRLDTWQHVCASWDGSGGTSGITLYLDGVAVAFGDSGSNGGATDSDANHDLIIGRVNNGTFEFDGVIDDFQLYDRVLSPSEIELIQGCPDDPGP